LREELAHHGAAGGGAPPRDAGSPSRLEELERLVEKRLGIAAEGLTVLREQFLGGLNLNVLLTLDAVQDELRLLRERVGAEVRRAAPGRVARWAHKPKALLVEDNPQERELLALFLRSEGLDVDTAGDGCDALDYLRGHDRPDVVLLDMGLPRLDGPATVQEIRRNPACAGLKIFAVSGHAPDEFPIPVGPAGVDRWFRKPVNPTTLVHDLTQELGAASASC
jgi:CheY-like chemotaxis protein